MNQETQLTPISAVPESQTENSPKVSSLIVLPYTTNLNTLVEYVLPFKHNRGKPPNRYSPDTEERRSKFLVANYVSTQHLSNPIQNFTKTLSSCHTPDNIEDALADFKWAQVIQEKMEALQKNITWKLITQPEGKKIVGVEMGILY